jgi:vacuolar-type H+-ATPase subunit H
MADRNIRSWVGLKQEEKPIENTNGGGLDRIRQLESQLADLRSRRDITTLTKEEFEILATETASTLIRAAQDREKKARLTSEKLLAESERAARELISRSEAKAKELLDSAEGKSSRIVKGAESEARSLLTKAQEEIESMLTAKKREASLLLSNAKREAENMVTQAVTEVASYRGWLTSAITEADRLYKIQTQSLMAAERAIVETRAKLSTTFERLANLQNDINANLDESNRPVADNFKSKNSASNSERANVVSIKKTSARGAKKNSQKRRA